MPQYVPRKTNYHTSQPQVMSVQYQQHPQSQYQPRLQMMIPPQEAQQQGQYQGMAQPQQQEVYQEHYMLETLKTTILEHQQPMGNRMYRQSVHPRVNDELPKSSLPNTFAQQLEKLQ